VKAKREKKNLIAEGQGGSQELRKFQYQGGEKIASIKGLSEYKSYQKKTQKKGKDSKLKGTIKHKGFSTLENIPAFGVWGSKGKSRRGGSN